jgi:hypothetical protein
MQNEFKGLSCSAAAMSRKNMKNTIDTPAGVNVVHLVISFDKKVKPLKIPHHNCTMKNVSRNGQTV